MSERLLKFRTPARCQNGHHRFLYYSVSFGKAVDAKWQEPQPCKCPTHETDQGYVKCGPEQQWTGLHDKSGAELFEGDLVSHSKYGDLYTVEWSPDAAGFVIRSKSHSCALSGLCQQYLEIVGHIYDGEAR